MKAERTIKVTTYSFDEAQYILTKFPDAYWNVVDDKITVFNISLDYEDAIYLEVQKWHKLKENLER